MTATRDRILDAASRLLESEGIAGLTTRAVCDATGVTAPTLYHHFGNKDGLTSALVHQSIEDLIKKKRGSGSTGDSILDLTNGWNSWIGVAMEKPNLFRLMIASAGNNASIMDEAYEIMRALVQQVADEGRLTCEPEKAARTIWAASNGILSMFLQGQETKEIGETADLMFQGLLLRLTRAD